MTDEYTPTPNLLWVDVETTGLDPEVELLLEVAVVVTDADLNELEAKSWVIHQEIVLNALSDFALKTHTENGLLNEVVRSGHTRESVDRELGNLMRRSALWPSFCVGDERPPLCGSSINFERQWLSAYLPEFYKYIHYRSIDVSSLKELMNRWMPDEAISRRDTSKHRALDDIRDSIDELRHYREVLCWYAGEFALR